MQDSINSVNVECDKCGAHTAVVALSLEQGADIARQNGWAVDDDMRAVCPSCRGEVVQIPTEFVRVRKRDKVAIVGFSQTSRTLAPFNDDTFDIWSLNELGMVMPEIVDKTAVWFNLHREREIIPTHREWLANQSKPVVLLEPLAEVPNALIFPGDAVMNTFGRYFSNSIAFMLCYAIMQEYEEIHLYGVDMAMDSEYGFQRPCCEYWIGYARGLGIKVHVPHQSLLLRCGYVYGYEDAPDTNAGPINSAFIGERLRDAMGTLERSKLATAKAEGECGAYMMMQHHLRCYSRDIGKESKRATAK